MIQLGKTPPFPVGPGRTYSVFDWNRMDYELWHDMNSPADPGGWQFRPQPVVGKDVSPIGSPIEALLRALPKTAKFIGRSSTAKGEIAVKSRNEALWRNQNVPGGAGMGGLGSEAGAPSLDIGKAVFYLGAAALAFGLVWKARQAVKSV